LLPGAQDQVRYREAAKQTAILNALPAYIALLDTQGIIISVNEAWRQFAKENVVQAPGYDIGCNYFEICGQAQGDGAADAHKIAEGIRSVLSGDEKSFTIEYPCHSPTGRQWFLLTVTPLADDPPNGTVIMQISITKRKVDEEAMRESEERFSGAMEHASIGVGLASLEGRWLKVNRALCDLVGYSEAELLARTFQDITHPDDLKANVENVNRLLAGEIRTSEMEKRYIHRRGHFVTILTNVSLVRDGRGQPRYFVAQIQDITERKRASALIIESRQRLALATESAHIGIWDWDLAKNKLAWDTQMYELYGIREQDFSGAYDAWQNGLHPEDRSRAETEIAAALAGAKDFHTEFRIVWPNGEVRHIEAHAVVQRAQDSSATQMIGVNWDITGRKRGENALRESEERYRDLFENASDLICK
jgi:PAS domain S-box-containing protein